MKSDTNDCVTVFTWPFIRSTSQPLDEKELAVPFQGALGVGEGFGPLSESYMVLVPVISLLPPFPQVASTMQTHWLGLRPFGGVLRFIVPLKGSLLQLSGMA